VTLHRSQESIILKDSGHINKALMMLEPVELDIAHVRLCLKEDSKGAMCTSLLGLPDRQKELLAHKLLLTARWMSASHVRHGDAITGSVK
jgi:hypothetical protein